MSKKNRAVLWILFAGLMLIRLTADINPLIILILITGVTAVVILKKCGMPSGKYRTISIAFSCIATAAYLGYQRNPFILIYGLFIAGIPTLLTSFAVFAVTEKYGGYKLLSDKGKPAAVKSILLGIASGAVLSVINTFLAGEETAFQFSLWKLLLSLNPAIFEEMACRAIFMAYCVYYSRGERMNAVDLFTMYFMMAVPHTVVHGYGFLETLELCILFGLPFSFLQKKRDIASAMISHGLVDAVRFTLTGIG